MSEDSGRSAALLTRAMRDYLRGEKDYAPSTERDIVKRIRDRMRDSLHDFTLLSEHFETLDPQLILEGADTAIEPALRSQVALVYQMAEATGFDGEQIVAEGIDQGRRGRAEVLAERLREDPQSVTLGELRDLQMTGVMSTEEIDELLSDKTRPPIGMVGDEGISSSTLSQWTEDADEADEAEEPPAADR